MKKVLLIIACCSMMSVHCWAEETTVMVVKATFGTSSIAIKDIASIKFGSETMIITPQATSSLQTQTYTLNDVSKIYFSPDATGIQNVNKNETTIQGYRDGNNFIIKGCSHGLAKIYNINGTLLSSTPISNNETQISLENLPQGLYLLNVGQTTIKIAR